MSLLVKKIHVSKQDIKNGLPRTSDSCPVALAVKRTLNVPDHKLVSVNNTTIAVRRNWLNEIYMNPAPRSVRRFVNKFDGLGMANKKVTRKSLKPFTFIFRGNVLDNS